ncbi:MAG: glycerophosphodiester phosphodiesterase [Clostridiales bacterium]|nr:glycerophosphodiester phosphodiesterase [Clostridiales bacterium]
MKKPDIIAHRGASYYAPQNTMPAFRKAAELSADGIETDVHLTKDNRLVLCHNYTIDETSDGQGKITDYTLSELMDFDFGSYFSHEFSNVKMPTLDELFEYLKTTAMSVFNVEIKAPKNKSAQIVRRTVEAAKAHGVFERLLISSFNYKILSEAKSIDEHCRTAFLYPQMGQFLNKWLFPPVNLVRRISAAALHPHHRFVNKAVVDKAHRLGLKVNVWTVNDEKRMRQLIDMGVDGIITDRPDEAARILEKLAAGV